MEEFRKKAVDARKRKAKELQEHDRNKIPVIIDRADGSKLNRMTRTKYYLNYVGFYCQIIFERLTFKN